MRRSHPHRGFQADEPKAGRQRFCIQGVTGMEGGSAESPGYEGAAFLLGTGGRQRVWQQPGAVIWAGSSAAGGEPQRHGRNTASTPSALNLVQASNAWNGGGRIQHREPCSCVSPVLPPPPKLSVCERGTELSAAGGYSAAPGITFGNGV